jgi:hypothetical protein
MRGGGRKVGDAACTTPAVAPDPASREVRSTGGSGSSASGQQALALDDTRVVARNESGRVSVLATTACSGHLEPLRGERTEIRARLEEAAAQRTGW